MHTASRYLPQNVLSLMHAQHGCHEWWRSLVPEQWGSCPPSWERLRGADCGYSLWKNSPPTVQRTICCTVWSLPATQTMWHQLSCWENIPMHKQPQGLEGEEIYIHINWCNLKNHSSALSIISPTRGIVMEPSNHNSPHSWQRCAWLPDQEDTNRYQL
jgi:hypothetical protein